MLYRSANTPSVFSLRNEIDRLFEDTFGTDGQRRAWLPAVDVQETGDAFTFELELPGVDPEQVDVTADNGVLTVRGEKARQSRKEGDEGRYHVVERSYGSFVRAFQLPQGAEEEQITAGFRNGVLMVRVPKAQRPQPRKIRVDAGSAAGEAERPAIQTGATTRESSESRSKAKAGATS